MLKYIMQRQWRPRKVHGQYHQWMWVCVYQGCEAAPGLCTVMPGRGWGPRPTPPHPVPRPAGCWWCRPDHDSLTCDCSAVPGCTVTHSSPPDTCSRLVIPVTLSYQCCCHTFHLTLDCQTSGHPLTITHPNLLHLNFTPISYQVIELTMYSC